MSPALLIFLNIVLIPTVVVSFFLGGGQQPGILLAQLGFATFMAPIAAFYTWIRVSNRSIQTKKKILWLVYGTFMFLGMLLFIAMRRGSDGGGIALLGLMIYFGAISIPLLPMNFLMFYLMSKPEATQLKVSVYLFLFFLALFVIQSVGTMRGVLE